MKKTAHNRIDMAGQTYNSWKVIEIDHEKSKGKTLYWKAECLECNKTFTVFGANIRNGLSKRCTACGCGHAHDKQTGQIRTKRTAQQSAHYYLFLQLRKSAAKRKHEWQLSEAQTISLITKNCSYCNIQPSLLAAPLKFLGLSQKRTESAKFLRNGIDRVDSSKGYVEDNVVTCCETCNKAKLSMTTEEFLAWVERVYNFRIKPKA